MKRKFLLITILFSIASTFTFSRPILVGIAGGTGSGKTYLSEMISEEFSEDISLVYQDAYYRDIDQETYDGHESVNFDHPDMIDFHYLAEHLRLLKDSHSIDMPTYDYVTNLRQKPTVEVMPKKIVLVEGILLLSIPEIRNLLDVKVFLDTDGEIRVLRRIDRDTKERGRTIESVHRQYLKTVHPMYKEFVLPSKVYADIVISGNGDNKLPYSALIELIRKMIKETDC